MSIVNTTVKPFKTEAFHNGAFTPVDGGASASGKLEVLGVIGHSCPPDANGCEGNTYESLETASWASK